MTQWGLDTLFNPAKRHMDEEKRRLLSTREEMGDSSGGKRIDLESGKVTIRRAEADGGDGESADDAADDSTGDAADKPARPRPVRQSPAPRATRAKKHADDAGPSPAAQRAAARRRRQSSEHTG